MTLSRFACALALLAVFGVLGVLFFPAIQGPYSAVHGPVTALQSARASHGLRMAIMQAGISIPGMWVSGPPVTKSLSLIDLSTASRATSSLDERDLNLRC